MRDRRHLRSAWFAAAFLFAAMLPRADAAIISIDVSPVAGPNAGLPNPGATWWDMFSGYEVTIFNNAPVAPPFEFTGLMMTDPFGGIAVLGFGPLGPLNLGYGDPIDSSLNFSNGNVDTLFEITNAGNPFAAAPDFGLGSYMGFRVSNDGVDYIYGWLEVTWDSATSTFEILSGAYESQFNTPINAGDGPQPVPEPGTWATAALLVGGGAFLRWRRRRHATA